MSVRPSAVGLAVVLISLAAGACSSSTPSGRSPATSPAASAAASAPAIGPGAAGRRTIVFDTDLAPDDLIALAFLLSAPGVNLVGVTVSGTGEVHCPGGVDIVLRVLERLSGPRIPVACGRESPLAGSHAFPDLWREGADQGSALDLPPTDRTAAGATAVELIERLASEYPDLVILATGPLTNVAESLRAAPALRDQLAAVYIMGGALHVPGNLTCCGAPEDNDVAEWNIYVDPLAAQVVVDSGVQPHFVSLDGTNQVPLTEKFARRVMETASTRAASMVAELFAVNPFMTDGMSFLWDPLAAEAAAGYPIGTFEPACIEVEVAEGTESGFTRPGCDTNNIEFLITVDRAAVETTLLAVLNGG